MPRLLFYLAAGEHKPEQTDSSHSNNNGPVVPIQNPPDPQNSTNTSAEHAEQDADDEAAEDTDDTRSDKCHVMRCSETFYAKTESSDFAKTVS